MKFWHNFATSHYNFYGLTDFILYAGHTSPHHPLKLPQADPLPTLELS